MSFLKRSWLFAPCPEIPCHTCLQREPALSRKLAIILGFSFILVALVATCLYFLYTAFSLGLTTFWDTDLQRWKVASTKHQPALKKGDVIESIGGCRIGYLHLLENCSYVYSRNAIFACFDAEKELCAALKGQEKVRDLRAPLRNSNPRNSSSFMLTDGRFLTRRHLWR
jgi:hypothetical protein